MNIELKEGFTQVCIWPACVVVNNQTSEEVKREKIEMFEALMFEKFKTRVQYLEEIETYPDLDQEGNTVKGTGGRVDLFFAVHHEDIGRFAVPRLGVGIRWIEDTLAMGNYKCHIYPDRVFKYVGWNHEAIKFPESYKSETNKRNVIKLKTKKGGLI